MAEIRPFAAIRPCREKAGKIAALPYDVYDRSEAKEAVAQNPESFLRIDRPETQFPDSYDMYAPEVYRRAHDILWEMFDRGDFIRDETPCYYIYEQTMNGRSQTGIAACASIDDYIGGVIRRHENTRAEKEADRIRHVDACRAQTGPIFLAYRERDDIRGIIDAEKKNMPEYDFVSGEGVRQRVWVLDNPDVVSLLYASFHNVSRLYIADGHHRAASAVRVGCMRRDSHPGYSGREEFNFFLCVLFAQSELRIMDYNRHVLDLGGFESEEFLERVSRIVDLTPLTRDDKHPKEKGTFSLLLDDMWYECRFSPDDTSDDPVKGLDVSMLQRLILEPVLGIKDPKTDSRISFVGGIRGIEELEHLCREKGGAAFAMYPTSIGELLSVADAGALMPPKSTWFEPKLLSGLFIHQID